MAENGDPNAFPFRGGVIKGSEFNFSFSGLKTAVLYAIRGQNLHGEKLLSPEEKANIAASFQRAAFHDLIDKCDKALKNLSVEALFSVVEWQTVLH